MTLPGGFFELFGRPARESSCECERSSGMMLGPVMNWSTARRSPRRSRTRRTSSQSSSAAQTDDAKVVDELFVRILSRPATPGRDRSWRGGVARGRRRTGPAAGRIGRAREAQLDAKQAEWEADQAPPTWTVLEPADMKSITAATFAKQPDQSVLVEGANGKRHVHGRAAHRCWRTSRRFDWNCWPIPSCPPGARAGRPTAT